MKEQSKRPYEIEKIKLKEAKSALGLASKVYRVDLRPGFDELVDIEIPLNQKFCDSREVNRATIRLFRWDANSKRFGEVLGSQIDPRWESVRARVSDSGVYVAAGASSNPWVGNAIATLRRFGPLLHDRQYGPIIRDKLCPVILCPNLLVELFDEIGDPEQHGLSSLPAGNLCQICLGGWPGHIVDLYPDILTPPHPEFCDLDEYLRRNPTIMRAIIWGNSITGTYDMWTNAQKTDLRNAFNTIRDGGEIGLPELAPATATRPDGYLTNLSGADAWDAYVAHIAHTLVVDACRWVNWSLSGMNTAELGSLLDSNSLFVASAAGGFSLSSLPPHGFASHGDPTRVYRWLRAQGVVASDQISTIGGLLDWCRDHLRHSIGPSRADNVEMHWQYRGFPPVERIISGTTHDIYGFGHWTAGCWGTSGFLRLVLRTVNIPATFETPCSHALPYFPTIDRYLSHGDDPYNLNTIEARLSGRDLLIDQAQFDAWFGEGVSTDRCFSNVGRRVRELAGS